MNLSNINNISIKWKLIIPFLFLAFLGTALLILVSIRFQQRAFFIQEKKQLFCFYQNFLNRIKEKEYLANYVANEISANPLIKKCMAENNVSLARQLCKSSHRISKECFNLPEFDFHLVDKTGKEVILQNRHAQLNQLVQRWLHRKVPELGLLAAYHGIYIYAVVPVCYHGHMLGLSYVTILLGKHFLDERTNLFHVNYSILIPQLEKGHFLVLATTQENKSTADNKLYLKAFNSGTTCTLFSHTGKNRSAILVAPLKNPEGRPIALLKISANRKSSLLLLTEYKRNLLVVGLIGFLLSIGIIFWITSIFIRPIGKLVLAAQEITSGQAIKNIQPLYTDEIGVLANALNEMLKSLDESRRKIQDYAENLEKKVQDRTRALQSSRERYRALVENVPLVVYQTDNKGNITFINQFIKNLLGYSPDDILQVKDFFHNRIISEDREKTVKLWENCLREAKKFEMEYRILDRNNQPIYVLDQAIPFCDNQGNLERVDGILVDITDSKKLQDKIFQSEELLALKEISSRLAHEIRNPLTIAGGFIRQLLRNSSVTDPNHKKLSIIASEIEKLENILQTTLAYIKPTSLHFIKTDLNILLKPLFNEYEKKFLLRDAIMEIKLDPLIPRLNMDPELFYQVIKNILNLILSFTSPGTRCRILSYSENSFVVLSISLEQSKLQKEKLDTLLYPFSPEMEDGKLLSLPLAKIIIQKHNGLLEINQLSENQIMITISLPISSEKSERE